MDGRLSDTQAARALLRLRPHLVSPPWGGTRLSSRYGKGAPGAVVGESWEVWRDNEIVGGPWAGRRLGEVVELPLLVKLVDVAGVLSVQVHPGDADAARLEGAANGKAEGWVVLEAAEGAKIAWGLTRALEPETLRARAQSGEIERDLAWIPANAGDVVDVPPGTIHTLSGQVLFYEVQQPSDLTYRLYDWGRPRALHLDKAVAVAQQPAEGPHPEPVPLGPGHTRLLTRPRFHVERLVLPAATRLVEAGWCSFTVIAGEAWLGDERVSAGESVVLRGEWALRGDATVLLARAG